MPRQVSLTALQGMLAETNEEVFLHLLTVSHASMSEPLRFVDNQTDIIKDGDTFIAAPFQITFPTDEEDRITTVRLTVPIVDRVIVNAVRALTTRPSVTLELVKASDPDTVELGPLEFEVLDVDAPSWDFMDLTLGYNRNLFEDVFPKDVFSPGNSPDAT